MPRRSPRSAVQAKSDRLDQERQARVHARTRAADQRRRAYVQVELRTRTRAACAVICVFHAFSATLARNEEVPRVVIAHIVRLALGPRVEQVPERQPDMVDLTSVTA